ncbi:MAG: 3-phosphoshikimate 1-carboxyvinyltransferase, partial [Legionellaceae bacterium]|nr:3-phosphoshikimate 1-carboxyvinyltransferase [Legionellaceae bacterium]
KELRVKESDRILSMVTGLQNLGIRACATEEGWIIEGGEMRGGTIDSFGDHRVAMAFAVAGAVAQEKITIRNAACIASSYPEFIKDATSIGLELQYQSTATPKELRV